MLRQQLEEEFKTCPEAQQHGPSTDHDFTVSLYWRYLGHAPDGNLGIHTARLQPTGTMTREHLEEEFKTCPEAQQHGPSTDHDFAVSLYWRYLGHAPDTNLDTHTARLEILIAVIGDSYTAGYGDNCIAAICSDEPPVEWVTSYQNAPIMPGCGYKYGWAPKLAWYLNNIGRNAKIVGQCTKRGASSKDMYDKGCGTITNNLNPRPTHVIIFAGLNDGGHGNVGVTWYNVTQIGSQIQGPRKIHIQGNGEWPNNWNQTLTFSQFIAGIQSQPCNDHPNGTNYWKMAYNLLPLINWDAPVA
jgi:lysophospholipase L1-like esterase